MIKNFKTENEEYDEDELIKKYRNIIMNGEDINQIDENKHTFLYKAVENNYEKVVDFLLDPFKNIRLLLCCARDNNGCTPLFIASKKNHILVVEKLIESGADINKPNNNTLTPLSIAIANNNHEIKDLLIKHGAK